MSRRAFETMAFDLYDMDNDGIIGMKNTHVGWLYFSIFPRGISWHTDVEELVDLIETNLYRESGVKLRDNIVSKVVP